MLSEKSGTESVAAHLAVQIVVTVVQFHHPRARELQRRVTAQLAELGAHHLPEWKALVSAFEVFARELAEHMRDEEGIVLDPVQFLMVRRRLVPGALSDVRDAFEVLRREHDTMQVLKRRLELELANSLGLQSQPGASVVRASMREFITAFTEHHDFEQYALEPALQPFLNER